MDNLRTISFDKAFNYVMITVVIVISLSISYSANASEQKIFISIPPIFE